MPVTSSNHPLPGVARARSAAGRGSGAQEILFRPLDPRNPLIRLESRKGMEGNGRKWKRVFGAPEAPIRVSPALSAHFGRPRLELRASSREDDAQGPPSAAPSAGNAAAT